MPVVAKELSDAAVRKLKPRKVTSKINPKTNRPNKNFGELVTAYHPVGGVSGLLLRVTPEGGKSWILRTMVGSRRRDIGLGGYPDVTLAQAREKARQDKEDIRNGIDPVEKRRKAQEALKADQESQVTFSEAWREYWQGKKGKKGKRDTLAKKTQQHWINSIENYAMPELGTELVSEIERRHVEKVLEPIWSEKSELARKLRGRLQAVFSWATVKGYRSGDNPAQWDSGLKETLGRLPQRKAGHFRSLDIDDAPEFVAALREVGGNAARAVEFAILTAVRSGEVRGARWAEIDLQAGKWTIPGERMKMKKEHVVPLPDAASELLEAMPRTSDLIFPAPRGGQYSDMALLAVLKRMGWNDRTTVHGFRAVFKSWAVERADAPDFVSEMALAHSVGDAVRKAYQRSDLVAKRRRLMREWSQFLGYEEQGAKVANIA